MILSQKINEDYKIYIYIFKKSVLVNNILRLNHEIIGINYFKMYCAIYFGGVHHNDDVDVSKTQTHE